MDDQDLDDVVVRNDIGDIIEVHQIGDMRLVEVSDHLLEKRCDYGYQGGFR